MAVYKSRIEISEEINPADTFILDSASRTVRKLISVGQVSQYKILSFLWQPWLTNNTHCINNTPIMPWFIFFFAIRAFTKVKSQDLADGPLANTPHCQCRRDRYDPWSEN